MEVFSQLAFTRLEPNTVWLKRLLPADVALGALVLSSPVCGNVKLRYVALSRPGYESRPGINTELRLSSCRFVAFSIVSASRL